MTVIAATSTSIIGTNVCVHAQGWNDAKLKFLNVDVFSVCFFYLNYSMFMGYWKSQRVITKSLTELNNI